VAAEAADMALTPLTGTARPACCNSTVNARW